MTGRAALLSSGARCRAIALAALACVPGVALAFVAKQALLQIPASGLSGLQLGLKRCLALGALRLHLAQDFFVTPLAPRSAGHCALVQALVEMALHDQLDVRLPAQRHILAGKRHGARLFCRGTRLHRKRLCSHSRNISEKSPPAAPLQFLP